MLVRIQSSALLSPDRSADRGVATSHCSRTEKRHFTHHAIAIARDRERSADLQPHRVATLRVGLPQSIRSLTLARQAYGRANLPERLSERLHLVRTSSQFRVPARAGELPRPMLLSLLALGPLVPAQPSLDKVELAFATSHLRALFADPVDNETVARDAEIVSGSNCLTKFCKCVALELDQLVTLLAM